MGGSTGAPRSCFVHTHQMCDHLRNLDRLVRTQPGVLTRAAVADFLAVYAQQFRPCVWAAVSGDYDAAVSNMLEQPTWGEFVKAWDVLAGAIRFGCCDARTEGRWAVTQTPAGGPWGGRAICAPTLHPRDATRRTYPSRGMCEMALQLLDPQAPQVPTTSYVTCSATGCTEHVDWAPKPTR